MQNSLDIKNLAEIRDEHYRAMYQISELLSSAGHRDSLLSEALDIVVKVTKAERGVCVRYDEADHFTLLSARNIDQIDIKDLSQFSSGILKQVVQTKKPQLYHDVQSDPQISQFSSLQIHSITSVIGVPIFLQDSIWGAIVVDSKENRQAFTQDTLHFLEFFSNMLSLALNRLISFEALQDENQVLRNRLEKILQIPNMIGDSPAMRQAAQLLHRVAKTDATVLLLGESGTGKDLAARAIHELSSRKKMPYLAQFCGSIPDTLLESELFGYKRGAFSGANADKKGLFEVASSGTFFLDEIADISMALQAKLLRVLQNQEIIRLGDTVVKKVDVRIITASNKNLKELVKSNKFREDLFYRLNVFPITLPPLRDRRSDIGLLAEYFVKKHGTKMKILPAAVEKLASYHWPGNVRQLENVLQRALILADEDKLAAEHILFEEDENLQNFCGSLRNYEMLLLKQRLKEFDNNRTLAARSLGVSVRWVQLKLKEL